MDPAITAILIMAAMIILFVIQAIPSAVTAVGASLAMMAVGIISPEDAIISFGSDTVMMVVGVIIIGNAVFETGLAERIGSAIAGFEPAAKTERRFLFTILLIVSTLSAFMSNTAAVAMFIPLVSSVSASSNGRIKNKNIFMAMGIASILGGNCTLAGSTPQLIAQGILEDTPGARPLEFFELAYVAVPIVLLMLVYYLTIGYRLQIKVFDFVEPVGLTKGDSGGSADKSRLKAIISGLVLIACIISFAAGVYSLGTVALIGACVCIASNCISCKRAFLTMDWNTVAVLGGTLGFSKGLNESGAVDLIANGFLKAFGGAGASPLAICAALIVLSAVLGNLMSHTATVAVLTPIAITLSFDLGISPTAMVVGVIIGANLAFATPISTPPLTMTLVGGYRFTDYTLVGGLLNVLCIAATIIIIPLVYAI